jgi:hypothetical protein
MRVPCRCPDRPAAGLSDGPPRQHRDEHREQCGTGGPHGGVDQHRDDRRPYGGDLALRLGGDGGIASNQLVEVGDLAVAEAYVDAEAQRRFCRNPHLRDQRAEVDADVTAEVGLHRRVVRTDDHLALAVDERRVAGRQRDAHREEGEQEGLERPGHGARSLALGHATRDNQRSVVPTVVSSWVARVRTT